MAVRGSYTIGVSNTLVGNGWREQMICAIKAEALASGVVDEVVVVNRNGGPTEQIADIESLISQGVDAIILNPTDREGLNPVLEAAIEQALSWWRRPGGDRRGRLRCHQRPGRLRPLGAEWLFEQLGGEGNVAYMRGIDGVPADTDRDTGFQEALEDYPGHHVVAETFTGWDPIGGCPAGARHHHAQDDRRDLDLGHRLHGR